MLKAEGRIRREDQERGRFTKDKERKRRNLRRGKEVLPRHAPRMTAAAVLRWPAARFGPPWGVMSEPTIPSPQAATVVDLGFIAIRAHLLEVAAFLDRVERHGVADDFRCVALRNAARLLADGQPARARRILECLSDPTTAPRDASDGKAAHGAWKGGAQ